MVEMRSAAARQIKKFLAAPAIWALPTISLTLSYLHHKIKNTQAWLNIRLCMLPTKYAIFSLERKLTDLMRWDQYGRPFIILREQGRKVRTHGVEAIKVRDPLFSLWKLFGPEKSTATYPRRKDSRQHHPDVAGTKRFFHLTRNVKGKLKYTT